MFTVTGLLGDLAYALRVDPQIQDGGEFGVIAESAPDRVKFLLAEYVGEEFSTPGLGRPYTLALSDGASILAALYHLTEVRGVTGDAPALVDESDLPAGAVV